MQFDRSKAEALRTALDAEPRALCRHSSGDWIVRGKHGYIIADGRGWLIEANGSTRRLDRLPTDTEAASICAAIGVKRRTP